MKAKQLPLEQRFDSMRGTSTGRGTTSRDKLKRLSPDPRRDAPATMRAWYRSNGFIENIVDAPAEDAVKEWITITTNRDQDDAEAGLEGLGISRLIMNRMDELNVRAMVRDLIRFSRMYAEGGFLYCGVRSSKPQAASVLAEPIADIEKISYLNVFGPDYVSVLDASTNPLSKYYHKRKYYVQGTEIHETRLFHMVRKYLQEEREGISVISTILDPIIAQDTSLWSVSTLVYEMALWVFKSPDFKTMAPEKLAATLLNMKSIMSTQSCMGIADDEAVERVVGTDAGKGFLKDVFEFIMENIAGTSQMPKSRLMGQAQGTITSGQYDLRGYYDSIAKFQETDVRKVLYWLIDIIIREKDGEIYKALNGETSSLDWEIKFNPLWREDPGEKAERELKEAQRDQIHIAAGVLSPSEVKQMRFSELEEFDVWENQSLDFTTPQIEPEEQSENEPE